MMTSVLQGCPTVEYTLPEDWKLLQLLTLLDMGSTHRLWVLLPSIYTHPTPLLFYIASCNMDKIWPQILSDADDRVYRLKSRLLQAQEHAGTHFSDLPHIKWNTHLENYPSQTATLTAVNILYHMNRAAIHKYIHYWWNGKLVIQSNDQPCIIIRLASEMFEVNLELIESNIYYHQASRCMISWYQLTASEVSEVNTWTT